MMDENEDLPTGGYWIVDGDAIFNGVGETVLAWDHDGLLVKKIDLLRMARAPEMEHYIAVLKDELRLSILYANEAHVVLSKQFALITRLVDELSWRRDLDE